MAGSEEAGGSETRHAVVACVWRVRFGAAGGVGFCDTGELALWDSVMLKGGWKGFMGNNEEGSALS